MSKFVLRLSDVIATWFFSGKFPYASGTVGSFFTLPLVFILYSFGSGVIFITSIILFLVGWLATICVLKGQDNSDPGFVVIDEVVGQTLSFLFVSALFPLCWWMLVVGFFLFRFFDIFKIWPASFFDQRVHSAFGVMMDDVVAGLYAGLVLYGICFIFI